MSYLSENLYQHVTHWRPLWRGFSVHHSHLNRTRWSTTSLEGILLINVISLAKGDGVRLISHSFSDSLSLNFVAFYIRTPSFLWHAMTRTMESYWMTVAINAIATRSTSNVISIRNVSISELSPTDFLGMQSDETVEVLARQRLLTIAYLHWLPIGKAFVSVHPCNRSRYDNRLTFSR